MMNRKLATLAAILSIVLSLAAAAQSSPTTPVEVQGGFRNLKLGMDIDQIKKLLKADPYFAYRGDPDVSFLPLTEEPLIQCAGTSYIEKATFQFHDRKLFIIILVLDPAKLDYFTMYQQLTAKYGKPAVLDPSQVIWNYNEVRLSLERPLNVKYIATEVFDNLIAANKGAEDYMQISRQEFLKQF